MRTLLQALMHAESLRLHEPLRQHLQRAYVRTYRTPFPIRIFSRQRDCKGKVSRGNALLPGTELVCDYTVCFQIIRNLETMHN